MPKFRRAELRRNLHYCQIPMPVVSKFNELRAGKKFRVSVLGRHLSGLRMLRGTIEECHCYFMLSIYMIEFHLLLLMTHLNKRSAKSQSPPFTTESITRQRSFVDQYLPEEF